MKFTRSYQKDLLEVNPLAELVLIIGTLGAELFPIQSQKRFKKLHKWATRNCCDRRKNSPEPRQKE